MSAGELEPRVAPLHVTAAIVAASAASARFRMVCA
jgi:hypothetical protein